MSMVNTYQVRLDCLEEFLQKEHSELQYTIVIEEEPLGTGGAIRIAIEASFARYD